MLQPFNVISRRLEGDRGRDRVQRCRIRFTPEIVLSTKFCKMANCIIVYIVNSLMLLLANF